MDAFLSRNKKNYSDKQKSHKIIKLIRYREQQLRYKIPILKYQDIIGISIMLASSSGMIVCGLFYVLGFIPAWLCIIANAIFASFLHEIEHDLIHNLYFNTNKPVQNFMFWIVWLFRANTLNPWARKPIHLLHHKKSGRIDDIEERLIGNGMSFGFRRWLTMMDPLMSLIIQGKQIKRDAHNEFEKFPKTFHVAFLNKLYYLLWYTFLLLFFYNFIKSQFDFIIQTPFWIDHIYFILQGLAVTYLIPAWIRQTCLQIVSSNMHYFGEINSVMQQTQILDSWVLLPLQLFCFNFGATHCMHHFVVNQPFYLRQIIAPFAKLILKKYGIKFNEFESMLKGNRYPDFSHS